MRRTRSFIASLAVVALAGVGLAGPASASHPQQTGVDDSRPHGARVALKNASGADVGTVDLGFTGSRMNVRVRATGVSPGFHGFHVHSVGACDGTTAPPFTSAGGHWNPDAAIHGSHDGDMPPLYANADGVVTADFTTDGFTLDQIRDADGSAVIMHAGTDNLGNIPTRYSYTNTDGSTGTGPDTTTKATGDAGARFACGVVPGATGDNHVSLPSSRSRTARAVLRTSTGEAAGIVRLAPVGTDRLHVSVDATGLTPGFHGFHVHAVGQCDGTTATPFSSAGGHLGSTTADHGQHDGDLPALFAAADGRARAEFDTDNFTLAQALDADGGALVVHAAADNLANIPTRYSFTNADGTTGTGPDAATKATGDSGGRARCGVLVVPPPPTAVALSIDVPVITAGNTPVLLSRVTDAAGAGAPDVEVTFWAKRYGDTAYSAFTSGLTDETGAVSLIVRPETQTAYVVRAGALASPRVLVQVNARVTLSSPAAGEVRTKPTVFRGTLTPAYVGAPVGLAMLTVTGAEQQWTYLGQTRSTAGGAFEISRTLPNGEATYVVYTPARQGTRRGSAALRLRVVTPLPPS